MLSFSYVWPIALVVVSNVIYHICSKSLPGDVNPFAALTVTYLVGMVCSAVLYFITAGKSGFMNELSGMNWSPYVLGVVIVGLEAGFMCAYKAGWPVSTASIVESTFHSIILLAVGILAFHEHLGWNKILGIIICMVGLAFINMK